MLMFTNLTACGGGSSGVIKDETNSTRIYVDNEIVVLITYTTLPASTIAGTFDQQTVTHALTI